jgi:cystathionine gamma-synthase
MDPVARQKAGLVDGLVRLSVGIEALEDLRADLEAGLERAAATLEEAPARRLGTTG